MMADIKIRNAKIQDLDEVIRLYNLLDASNDMTDARVVQKVWHHMMHQNGLYIFVAERGIQLLSTCTLIIVPNLTRRCRPYALIENVITDPAARRMGLAKRVLKASIDKAWQENCYKIMLLSRAANQNAHNLYDKLGFKRDKIGFQLRK